MGNKTVLKRYLRTPQALCALTLSALLGACQPSPAVQSNVQFKAPERILQVRAIDRSQLRPSVSLSNGQTIPMQQTGDNIWSGSINVQPNSSYFVTIEWIETMPEGDLVLATWAENVDVGADGEEIILSEDNYDLTIDQDGDGISNLMERQNNTNPFVPNDEINGEDNGEGNGDGSVNAGNTAGTDLTDSGSSTDGTSTDGNTGTDGTSTQGTTTTGGTDADGTDGQTTDANTSGSIGGDNTTSGTEGGSPEPQTEPTVLIPRISASSAPVIDGLGAELNGQDNLIGEWEDAVQFDNSGERLWINNLMIDIDADSADGAELRRWAAVHDGEYLYVLVLSDDIGQRQADSLDHWQDDSLELFIDGNNSKLSTWGDDDDAHLLIPLLKQNSTNRVGNNEINGRFSDGPRSVNTELDIEFFTGPGIGPDGIRAIRFEQDVYELAIPIASAGITAGEPFGFELQLNDDDDGGSRESKWGWFHPSRSDNTDTDTSYMDPSVMGTVVLEE